MSTVVTDEATLRRLVAEEVEVAVRPILEAVAQRRGIRGKQRSELMTRPELADLLRVDARTLRRMVLAGEVPPPISIGDRTDRWRRSTLESFLRNKEKQALTAGLRRGSMS